MKTTNLFALIVALGILPVVGIASYITYSTPTPEEARIEARIEAQRRAVEQGREANARWAAEREEKQARTDAHSVKCSLAMYRTNNRVSEDDLAGARWTRQQSLEDGTYVYTAQFITRVGTESGHRVYACVVPYSSYSNRVSVAWMNTAKLGGRYTMEAVRSTAQSALSVNGYYR